MHRERPSHPHSQPSASFLELLHQGAGIGQQVQDRECAGDPPQVVKGVGDTTGAAKLKDGTAGDRLRGVGK